MAESAALLVDEVFPEQPVRPWVLSFPYPMRFLFASCPAFMGRVLGIVYRCIATHLIKKAGFTRKTAQAGAVTLIQRFGSALNFNVHSHMLFLDGVYVERPDGSLHFRWVKAPTSAELVGLTQTLALRIGRYLEPQELLERDAENGYLAGDDREAGPMEQLLGSSMMCMEARMSRAQDAQECPTYRIAVGPQQGR
jgi:hypothetical protein